MKEIYIFVTVIMLSFGLGILAYIRVINKIKNNKIEQFITKKNNKLDFVENVYNFLEKVPIINKFLVTIKTKLYIRTHFDENTLRYIAVKILSVMSISIMFFGVLIISLYKLSIYMILILGIVCFYVYFIILDIWLENIERKILYQLPDFIAELKHTYHEYKMIDETFYYASKNSDYEIGLQGEKIYNILSNSYDNEEIDKYCETNSNKFLKMIIAFSYITKEYGDKIINGSSLFVKNMNYILEEIHLEILKNNLLQYKLQGLTLICIFPIFMLGFIENWTGSNFEQVQEFYNSSQGFIVKNFIFFIAIICFVFLIQMQKIDENKKYRMKTETNFLEGKLLNVKFIKELINKLKPKEDTKKHKKLLQLLQSSGSYIQLEIIYIRRLTIFLVSFLLMLILLFTTYEINLKNILKDNKSTLINQIYFENKLLSNVKDDEVIKKIKHIKSNKQDAITVILKQKGLTNDNIKIISERIQTKLDKIKKQNVNILQIFIILILSWLMSFIPILQIYLQKKMRKIDMQDEVFQFNTIILILMYYEKVSVEMILEWMEKFGQVFSNPLRKCLNNFENGNIKSLEELKKNTKYKPFTRIIDNLKIAVEKIKIQEAFDSLETERNFYKEERKNLNMKMVEEKVNLGKMIGFIPFYVMIIFYFALPILYASCVSLSDLLEQLKATT